MRKKYKHIENNCGGNISYHKTGKYFHLFRCDKCKKLIIGNSIKYKKPDILNRVT